MQSIPAYTTSWVVSDHQRKVITCLAIRPDGERLIVTSEDSNLLLIKLEDGSVLVTLCFENQFTVLSALWYSKSNVLIGASNGALYDVCFDPTNVSCLQGLQPMIFDTFLFDPD